MLCICMFILVVHIVERYLKSIIMVHFQRFWINIPYQWFYGKLFQYAEVFGAYRLRNVSTNNFWSINLGLVNYYCSKMYDIFFYSAFL